MSEINICVHCEERCKGKYCSGRSTAAGRKKLDDEQKALEEERKKHAI